MIVVMMGQLLCAQEKLPVIKANSNLVSIRDGKVFNKNNWTIVPEAKPDVYVTRSKNEKVTFYTDIDSITVDVKEDTQFDFMILLNGTKKAYTQIKYAPPFIETLKNAHVFNSADSRKIPEFTYQDKNDPNLVALRKGLKLDSIAGTGNEVSKILNLLHWVHRVIPHDGQHGNPQVKNAMNMLKVCKAEGRGLNCRGLATVLNECYLAMGIKSRFVTCLPKDPNDTECHVINMVYAEELKKWLWIDPTHDSYVMNEKGELLGIDEVRERLINDKPLILNPDANWNFKASTTKEYHLYEYMAKNLYRFETPVNSGYNLETQETGKTIEYISLSPLDYPTQKPDKEEIASQSGTKFVIYKTNNPEAFWEAPKK